MLKSVSKISLIRKVLSIKQLNGLNIISHVQGLLLGFALTTNSRFLVKKSFDEELMYRKFNQRLI